MDKGIEVHDADICCGGRIKDSGSGKKADEYDHNVDSSREDIEDGSGAGDSEGKDPKDGKPVDVIV